MNLNEIGSAQVTPRELQAILLLLEGAIDLGLWDEHGVEVFSEKEVAALYAKLAATEDLVDSILLKEKASRTLQGCTAEELGTRIYTCKACNRPTKHASGYCSNDEYTDCGAVAEDFAQILRDAYCG